MEPVRFVVGPLAVNALILPSGSGDCVVVDPGGDPDLIIAYISSNRLSVSHIVLTHGHWDHLAALNELSGAWPTAAIAIHEADSPWLGIGALARHRAFFASLGAAALVPEGRDELPGANLALCEGLTIGEWKVLHTPGHSPGSVSLYRETDGTLVSGDTLFRSGYGRTDGPGGNDEALAESLRRLLALPPETRVFPGHGSGTTIGAERAG